MTNLPQPRWLSVDPTTFDPAKMIIQKGVEFHVFVSPYDLPDAVRGHFDAKVDRFLIEFRYLSNERAERVRVDPHVVLDVGVRSRRLQRIEVDVNGLGAGQVALRIDKAIDSLPSLLRSSRVPQANFEVARNVLRKKQPELLNALGD